MWMKFAHDVDDEWAECLCFEPVRVQGVWMAFLSFCHYTISLTQAVWTIWRWCACQCVSRGMDIVIASGYFVWSNRPILGVFLDSSSFPSLSATVNSEAVLVKYKRPLCSRKVFPSQCTKLFPMLQITVVRHFQNWIWLSQGDQNAENLSVRGLPDGYADEVFSSKFEAYVVCTLEFKLDIIGKPLSSILCPPPGLGRRPTRLLSPLEPRSRSRR